MVAVEISHAEAESTAEVNTVQEENAHQIDESVNMPKQMGDVSQIALDLSHASVEQSTIEHNADVGPVIVARSDEVQNTAQIENRKRINAFIQNPPFEPSPFLSFQFIFSVQNLLMRLFVVVSSQSAEMVNAVDSTTNEYGELYDLSADSNEI